MNRSALLPLTTAYVPSSTVSSVDVKYDPSVNKEYLSQIQFYSLFCEFPVTSSRVVINDNSLRESCKFYRFPANKRTKWAELSRYYLCMLFCKVIFEYRRVVMQTTITHNTIGNIVR